MTGDFGARGGEDGNREGVLAKYIAIILSQRPDITREQLLEAIERKSKEAKVSSSYRMIWSVFMVAHDLGVKLEQVMSEPIVKITNLTPGLRNVNILGRVVWSRVDEVTGTLTGEKIKLCRMVLGDETGWCYVVLWRDLAESVLSQGVSSGEVIRLRRAYCKEGRLGLLEVHGGINSAVDKVDDTEELPHIDTYFVNLSELDSDSVVVHVEAVLRGISPMREFERSKERRGYLRRIIVGKDGTEISASLWDGSASEITEEDVGKRIRLVGARVRQGLDGRPELAVDSGGGVVLMDRVEDVSRRMKLRDVRPGDSSLRVEAKVIKVFPVSRVSFKELGDRYCREMIVADETDTVDLLIWGSDESLASDAKEGDVVLLEGVSAKLKGDSRYLQLGRTGVIGTVEDPDHGLKSLKVDVGAPTRIGRIKDGARNLVVDGVVTSDVNTVEIQPRFEGGSRSKTSFLLSDDTGTLSVVAWGSEAQKVKGLRSNVAIRIRYCDARHDAFSDMLQLVISGKTELEEI